MIGEELGGVRHDVKEEDRLDRLVEGERDALAGMVVTGQRSHWHSSDSGLLGGLGSGLSADGIRRMGLGRGGIGGGVIFLGGGALKWIVFFVRAWRILHLVEDQ